MSYEERLTCLQCNLEGFRCTFTSEQSPTRYSWNFGPKYFRNADSRPRICCGRCRRINEPFCIQVKDQVLETGWALWKGKKHEAWRSPGVQDHIVHAKVLELLKNAKEKTKFMLPMPRAEMMTYRKGMRKPFGNQVKDTVGVPKGMTLEEWESRTDTLREWDRRRAFLDRTFPGWKSERVFWEFFEPRVSGDVITSMMKDKRWSKR
ncbi:uncharacterized protein BP5553_06938 [Venustampulla echinocandica]|uniref:Uncharacterized protein n=1 Tax=Venustampulla echinocandica TaxID=2656787 RepID=A0A370TI30_9HELO|nr:uncharacterized protein BP5553_06938 [Venustampulla echinocandica]RDL35007.1 hypothetical protein BP5553_06938 [Venustampulla echinocandica]